MHLEENRVEEKLTRFRTVFRVYTQTFTDKILKSRKFVEMWFNLSLLECQNGWTKLDSDQIVKSAGNDLRTKNLVGYDDPLKINNC